MNAGTYASSIAYFAFLSLVPLLALCISLVSVAGLGEQEVARFCVSLVPDALKELVGTLVDDAFARSDIAFSLSTITLLWSASKGVKALRGGLNATYAVEESRNALSVALISIVAVLVLGVMFAGVLYLVFSDVLLRAISAIVPTARWSSGLIAVISPIVTLALGVLVIAICYAYLPAGSRKLKTQLPGALAATIACGLLSFGFRVYVEHFSNFTVLYGSIATVALFLFWMYLVSYILMAGGFLNRVLMGRRQGMGLFSDLSGDVPEG